MRSLRITFVALAALVSVAASAQTTPVPITSLPLASNLLGMEALPGVQSGNAVKITPLLFQGFLEGTANTWTASNIFSMSDAALGMEWTDGTMVAGIEIGGSCCHALEIGTANAYDMQLFTDDVVREDISPAGNITIQAPTSGASFTIATNGSAQPDLVLTDISNSGQFTVSFDSAGDSYLQAGSNTALVEGTAGTGELEFITDGVGRGSISSVGNWTIDTPSSGGASLSINALDNIGSFVVSDGTTTGQVDITGGLFEFGTATNSTFALFSDDEDRMLLSANGDVIINAPTSGNPLSVGGIAAGGGVTGYLCWTSSSGVITYDTAAACPTSSERFKHDIKSLNAGLDEVERLHSISYEPLPQYDPQYHGRKAELGFIAEEVAKIDPRLVEYGKDGKPLTVIYDRVTVVLVEALHEEHRHVLELAASQLLSLLWLIWLTYRTRSHGFG